MLCLCCFPDPFARQSESLDKHQADLIVPAQSVGLLKLGDTRARAQELFPYKPDMDQEWQGGVDCGTTVNWLDWKGPKMVGNLFILFKEGKVFQIDSGSSSFHTSDGKTLFSTPEEVRRKYPNLRAYILSEATSEAVGGRPLVYWVDSEKGIAFGFAYSRRDHKRYLNWIIIFKPHTEVCPDDGPLSPSDKRELAPYSLETGPH
jgi:hypothetical protein